MIDVVDGCCEVSVTISDELIKIMSLFWREVEGESTKVFESCEDVNKLGTKKIKKRGLMESLDWRERTS